MPSRRLTICLEGLYYLVVLSFIAGGAVLRNINLLYVVAGLMTGPLIYNWRAATSSVRGLTIRRRLPSAVCAGDLLVVEFEASRRPGRGSSAAVVVTDRVERDDVSQTGASPDSTGREPFNQWAEVFFPEVSAGATEVQSYRGRLNQRGRYRFGPFHVSSRYPLGLVRCRAAVRQEETLIVCPRLGRLTPRWRQLHQAAWTGSGGSRRRQGLLEGDFYGLRDWRSGDSRRWVHWRTSARRGQLAVRQFEQPRSQDLVLLVDLWRSETPSPTELDNVELAVSFAATVAEDVCRRGGGRLSLGVAGVETTWKEAAASRPLLTELMEQLALVQASPDAALEDTLLRGIAAARSGAMLVAVSTRELDLHDAQRFARIWTDPAKRHVLRRIVQVHVDGPRLADLYES